MYKIQKTKDEKWIDESGQEVPIKYVTKPAREREKNASTIIKGAKTINRQLNDFKSDVIAICKDVYSKAMEEYNAKADSKGNFTWFNFDRSIKIEVSINERIDFDDLTIQACKSKFDEFLSINVSSKLEMVKEMVSDVFSTSRGKLDAKKVMSLLKYSDKITDPLFQEAVSLLKSSIRRPDSKTYFRIWERAENGSYQIIDLNFSSL